MPDTPVAPAGGTVVVALPQLGESVSEGTIGRWLKQPGERVERDEPLAEVQTDKVNAEIPSPVAGVLQEQLVPEGATVAVKTNIAVIAPEGSAVPAAAVPAPAVAPAEGLSSGAEHGATDGEPEPASGAIRDEITGGTGRGGLSGGAVRGELVEPQRPRPDETTPSTSGPHLPTPTFTYDRSPGGAGPTSSAFVETAPAAPTNGAHADADEDASESKRFYTPVVLRMAQEHHLDLSQIKGTGLNGRVTRKDVERALAAGEATRSTQPLAQPAPPTDAGAPFMVREAHHEREMGTSAPAPQAAPQGDEIRPLTPMRRSIAQHMARARADIPDAWTMVEVDVTKLDRWRASFQTDWQAREGYEFTYLPFFVKAVLAGLRAVPELNATWAEDHVVVHRRAQLGIAVSIEGGLVVPVLRDADQLSLAGTATALRTLIVKARGGRLAADDLQGATFTVNNPGALGSIMSQPVVPYGQAGIVTMEAIVKRPVVTADDAIAIRAIMNCCLSFDHRVLDGAQALRFLNTVKQQLEAAEFSLY